MDPATLLCERCGYVIEGLDERGACPECGKPIAESVPERRTGVPIEPDADGKVNWWRAAWAVLWRPGETFERVRIDAGASSAFRVNAQRFAAVLTAVCGSLAWFIIGFGRGWSDSPTAIGLLLAFGAAFVALVIACGSLLLKFVRFAEQRGLRLIARGHGWRLDESRSTTIVNFATIGWAIGLIVPLSVLVFASLNRVEAAAWNRHERAIVDYLLWTPERLGAPGWTAALASLIVPLFLFELLCYIGIRRCKFANQPRIRSAEPGAGGSTSVPPASE